MRTKNRVLADLLLIGILMAPIAGPLYGASERTASPRPEKQGAPGRDEIRRQKNRKFIAGMNALPRKIEVLLKRSPDLSGS